MDLPVISEALGIYRNLYRHRGTLRAMGALALLGLRRGERTLVVPHDFAASAVHGALPAFNAELCRDFMRVTRADPAHFRSADGGMLVPPTFYVTWAMAVLARSLVALGLPYDYARVLHAASEVRYRRPLYAGEPADYAAEVIAIDDNERRARVRVECIVREQDGGAEIFRQTMELHVPKKAPARAPQAGRPSARPEAAPNAAPNAAIVAPTLRLLAELPMPADLGRRYALVSGDFNPVHWSRPAARALGFKGRFVQGYCTKAMIAHAVIGELLRGASDRLSSLRVEFKKPIYLPAKVGLFIGAPTSAADGFTPSRSVTEASDGTLTRTFAVGRALEAEAAVTGQFSYRV